MIDETYLVISREALPDIYEKVLYATSLLDTGEAKNTSEAVKMAGISRSVFYKYKDLVFSYTKKESSGILTVQLVLADRPGVLVNVLSVFYKGNANILTVTQNIPVRGRAFVSVSANISDTELSANDLLVMLKEIKGVIKIDSLTN